MIEKRRKNEENCVLVTYGGDFEKLTSRDRVQLRWGLPGGGVLNESNAIIVWKNPNCMFVTFLIEKKKKK